ncbi:MAG: type VI secretion system membrane subunit TssM [Planctomycetes bacterium]|nr:type VI secretion system membrane subunit TssM [Planctomycetota bacterium]
MKNLIGALAKEGTLGIMVLVVLIALIWLGGNYLEWDQKLMILLTVGVLLAFLVMYFVQKMLAVKRAMNIENQLRAQASAHVQSTIPDKQPEIEALQGQFNEALAALKASGLGKDALYKLPWYPIIGPPGAGKSTALQESGLNFPSMGTGPRAIRGIGGTRNCDWWFTDEGILLDTAGRYTTEIDDQAEWFSFLDLLRKSRPGKPINGAIVAISIADLVSATDAQIEEYSKTIRDRLDELSKRLELIFPVYLLFTKCDLLQGFIEFFEDFGKNERSQAWGVTLKYTGNPGRPYEEIFLEETTALAHQLRDRRVGYLGTERPVKKKQNVYLFPLQFEMAQKRLSEFIGQLFRPNPFQESAILRGFYFSSGTQKGTPVDQVVAALSKAFGIETPAEEQQDLTIERKSFFLKDLFTKIIFPDRPLARPTASVRRRNQILRWATVGVSLLFLALFAFWHTVSFIGNSAMLYTAGKAGKAVRETEREKPKDLKENLLALDDLRGELVSLSNAAENGAGFGMRGGLYRGNEIHEPLRQVYFARIKTFFVMPMKEQMEKDLVSMRDKPEKSMRDHDRMFDLHRAYRMLAINEDAATREEQKGALPENIDVLKRVLDAQGYWLAGPRQSGAVSPELEQLGKNQMEFLLTQLKSDDEWRYKMNKELVERINQYLSGALWKTESYNDIVTTGRGNYGKVSRDFLLQSENRQYVEFRESSQEFTFSQIYTQEVYNRYVKGAISEKSQTLASRLKQLRVTTQDKEETPQDIEKQLLEVYKADYQRLWIELLKRVVILPFANVEQAAARLKALCGPQSPVLELFKDISEQQVLTLGANSDFNRSTVDLKVVDELCKKLLELQVALDTFYRAADEGTRFVGDDEKAVPRVAALTTAFETCIQDTNKIFDRVATDTRERERVADVFRQIIANAANACREDCLIEANKLWHDKVALPFQTEFADKFPIKEDAQSSVPLATFSKMFNPTTTGPGAGTIAVTLNRLQKLNQTKVNNEQLLIVRPEFWKEMDAYRNIVLALYPADSTTISVSFTVTLKQRPTVSDFTLTISGDSRSMYGERSNSTRTYQMAWKEGSPGAKLEIFAGTSSNKVSTGDAFGFLKEPWGAMRLFYKGTATTMNDINYTFVWASTVPIMGRPTTVEAEAELIAKDKINPFKKGFFAQFKCPKGVGP